MSTRSLPTLLADFRPTVGQFLNVGKNFVCGRGRRGGLAPRPWLLGTAPHPPPIFIRMQLELSHPAGVALRYGTATESFELATLAVTNKCLARHTKSQTRAPPSKEGGKGPTAMTDQWKIVRQANSNGGPCEVLGPLLEEQTTRLVYRCQTGLKAHIPKRLVHLEPCRSCADHHRSRFPDLAFKFGSKQNTCSQTSCDCGWWKVLASEGSALAPNAGSPAAVARRLAIPV